MPIHPAEVSKEIRCYPFFNGFTDDLLLQASAMVKEISFKAGEMILSEGQENKKLFFLRSGEVEIFLSGEVIAKACTVGEVFGEMSVITSNRASTSVRATVETQCFVINSDDFEYVHPKDRERFQSLLYRIYCSILTDRLNKTNEKARLFEILNRELHEAQQHIQKVGGRVLLVETNKKMQLPVRMALGGTGVHLDVASDIETANLFLSENKYDTVLCEESMVPVVDEVRRKGMATFPILLTNQNVVGNLEILEKFPEIDYIISRNPEDNTGTIRTVITALSKLMNQDIFGIEKYLTWGADIQSHKVVRSNQREELKETMFAYFKKMGIRSTILERVRTVTEEMLMNAIYDAPVDSKGQSLFNHLPRTETVTLDSHQQATLSYATDGVILAVSIRDPFGALTRELIVKYLLSCYQGRAGSLNENKGGAGRGLHQIIENAELTIFNVKKGVRSEVICLFNVDGQKKETQPSFHYFFTQ